LSLRPLRLCVKKLSSSSLIRKQQIEHLVLPPRERLLHHLSQLSSSLLRQSLDDRSVHRRTFNVGVFPATRLHKEKREERHHYALERVSQIGIVRQIPYLAMKREIRFVEEREVHVDGRLLHVADRLTQTLEVCFGNVFFGPLDRKRFEFHAQAKNSFDISWAELRYCRSFVRSALHKALMLEFNERFTNQRNSGAELLGDLGFHNRGARLNRSGEDRLLQSADHLISF